MKIQLLSFFNRYIIIIFLILITFLKLFSIYEIQKNRELPIEPDDTFVYFAQSFLGYEDNNRVKKTMQSAKDIVYSTYEQGEESLKKSKDVAIILSIEHFFVPTYFLYSKVLGFLSKYFHVDRLDVWWGLNYASQILILISSFFLIQLYGGKLTNISKIILIISSFFFVLSVKHHINATPMTIGASLLIIGNYFTLKKNYLIGFIIIFLSCHIHPGIFLISTIFLGLYLTLFILDKEKKYFEIFIRLMLPLFLALIIEQFFNLFGINHYLGIFEQKFVGAGLSKLQGLDEIFILNYKATINNFLKMIYPFVPFFFQNKIIVFLLYILSIIIALKSNREIFILNLIILISILLGCFKFIAITHPGNMIFYQSQAMIPIISISFFNMYFLLFIEISKLIKIKGSYLLILFVSIIFLFNSYRYINLIEWRTNRMNYENIVPQIIEFERQIIKEKDDAIIIGDELVSYIFFSLFVNTHFYLDNELRNDNKIWHSKVSSYKPKGFIGSLKNQKDKIEKNIKFGEQNYTFSKVKKFKDFYFLYD